jgi:hypothetical protein
MNFEEGYCVVRGLVHPQTLLVAKTEFEILKNVIDFTESRDPTKPAGDEQVPKSFAHYGSFVFEALMESIRPDIEKITGKNLFPTYSYARIYYPGAILEKHKDRYSCEYSATVCIENNGDPWDIYFENKQGKAVNITLEAGDAIIYKGCELTHWREPYTGQRQIQAFLHYIDADGPFLLYKYDTRPMLGMSPLTKHTVS